MEHIEEAGVHSGDSACSLPPCSLAAESGSKMRRQTEALAHGLNVVGLMNVQFAVQGDDIFILEVNPRASRTVPFVAKAVGHPVAKIAARVMAGEKLSDFEFDFDDIGHVAVKEAVFPFARFPGVDVLLGPEMKSTGEVMGLDRNFVAAFAKSQLAAGNSLPLSGCAFISVKDSDKDAAAELAASLSAAGFSIIATSGTARMFQEKGIDVGFVKKVREGRPHIVDALTNGEIDLMFNTTEGRQSIKDSYDLRRAALLHRVPYYTTISGARAAVRSIENLRGGHLDVAPLQSYF
jgi:carbamoyl-phosphate synthase large subunit